MSGRWEVATYTRQGTANSDVELIVAVETEGKDGAKGKGASAFADGAVSEWASTLSFKVELDSHGAGGDKLRRATVVPRFKAEHLKRRSGKNDLLEGMKAAHMAR